MHWRLRRPRPRTARMGWSGALGARNRVRTELGLPPLNNERRLHVAARSVVSLTRSGCDARLPAPRIELMQAQQPRERGLRRCVRGASEAPRGWRPSRCRSGTGRRSPPASGPHPALLSDGAAARRRRAAPARARSRERGRCCSPPGRRAHTRPAAPPRSVACPTWRSPGRCSGRTPSLRGPDPSRSSARRSVSTPRGSSP